MTRINKESLKAKKESQRAVQYPRTPEPVPEPTPEPAKKAKKAKRAKRAERRKK